MPSGGVTTSGRLTRCLARKDKLQVVCMFGLGDMVIGGFVQIGESKPAVFHRCFLLLGHVTSPF